MDTPVLFCIYNRPEVTREVFDRIASVKPKRLFIAADGPNQTLPDDTDRVTATRQVTQLVDWDCEIKTSFSPNNLGCRNGMNRAIDWVFRYVDEAIILEDDCLPEPSFFEFCAELLDKYRDDRQVMMISGDNFQVKKQTEDSYYFSKYGHIWGWATWRRAWRNQHDSAMNDWPKFANTDWLDSHCPDKNEREFWSDNFQNQFEGKIDTWDYAWQYSIWRNSGLVAIPENNQVSNIGFGDGATHTVDSNSRLSKLPTAPIDSIRHPAEIKQNLNADEYTWENIFKPRNPAETEQPKTNSMWQRLHNAWRSGDAA